METIRLNIAGREYPLSAAANEVESLRQAADAINAQFDAFRQQFQVDDPVDLLAMTALQLTSSGLDRNDKKVEPSKALTDDSLKHIEHLRQRIHKALEL
ncbi:MAG: cell division protein ZapA [Flavobacteriales bacterium]|jgi:cell division protein ZapA (FtsZ GTPase activity inhibitor)